MRRLLLASAIVAGLATLLATPAHAQYGGGGGTPPPPPEAPPSGCPVEDPPPADPPPCHPRERASVSDRVVQPGDSVTVSTPPVFAPNSEVTINLVRAKRGSTPALSESSTANSTGATSDSITIPDVDDGVYFLYVEGVDADGNRVVAIVPIVVRGGSAQAASVQGASVSAASAAPVPAAVTEVQTDLSGDTEAAIVDAVSAGDTGLVLSSQGELQVRTPQGTQAAGALATTGNDISGYVTAGGALILAGTGFVLLRRRKEARL